MKASTVVQVNPVTPSAQTAQKICRKLIGAWGWQTFAVPNTWTIENCRQLAVADIPPGYALLNYDVMCMHTNGTFSVATSGAYGSTPPTAPSPNCGW
jgi:hypothetical protein